MIIPKHNRISCSLCENKFVLRYWVGTTCKTHIVPGAPLEQDREGLHQNKIYLNRIFPKNAYIKVSWTKSLSCWQNIYFLYYGTRFSFLSKASQVKFHNSVNITLELKSFTYLKKCQAPFLNIRTEQAFLFYGKYFVLRMCKALVWINRDSCHHYTKKWIENLKISSLMS